MQSLLASLLLASCALAAPYNAPPPSCVSKSERASLTVHNFDFHWSKVFTTPAHQNSYGWVNFTLSNTALNDQPVCSSMSEQLEDFYYGTQVYTCQNPKKTGDVATYTFNAITNTLQINQTWYCPSEGARFTAEGHIKLPLKCETKSYKNPNWKLGETYSSQTKTCAELTRGVNITQLSAVE